MTIHHTQVKKAEKIGVVLSEEEGGVVAHWPKRNIKVTAGSAGEAIEKMEEAQANYIEGDDDIARNDDGIPLDGAVAYSEGISAADCPYTSETDDADEYQRFVEWNDAWDDAADKAVGDQPGGSVVSDKYRAIYAEKGHPTHCGDWLAVTLNNLCIGKKRTDLEQFETICGMNGVDTSKYKRDGKGWQGRLRMTGRNLLAKKVYLAGGVIKAIDHEGKKTQFKAPKDWMQAQKYKMPKSEQSKPIPEAADDK